MQVQKLIKVKVKVKVKPRSRHHAERVDKDAQHANHAHGQKGKMCDVSL